jgi:Fe-S cluster assembly iron-binding protein IscA
VHVTPQACEALSQLLAKRSNTDRCLRLSTVQGNYRFILDEPIDQDVRFSHEGRVVLVVSETVSRDLWGITVDTTEADGKRKLIFRKAKVGEPFDVEKEEEDPVPPGWKASEHERLLAEIAEIGKQIASLRGGSKSMIRDQLQTLEAAKQEKWDAIRALWAGDGGWHKRQAALAAEAD